MGILGDKTFKGGKETGGWKSTGRGVDEVRSSGQVSWSGTIGIMVCLYHVVEQVAELQH